MTGSSVPTVWATVLAGGVGHRFWPLSTPARPKQLLALGEGAPLVAETVGRAQTMVPPQRLRILAGESLVGPIRDATGLSRDAFLVEPRARGTGPVLVRAAWEAVCADPEAVMISLHSDHVIRPAAKFREVLECAVEIASRDRLLMTVAVPPSRPDTGFGYVKPGDPLPAGGGHRAYRVDAFVEKPDRVTAAEHIAAGYRWNSGIFVWPAGVFLEEVRAHAPEVAKALPRLEKGDVPGFFAETETISVDEAVLERSARVGSVDATFEWDDMGSWEAFARHRAADDGGNTTEGDVHCVDARNSVAVAESGRVVLLGTEGILVVQTDHATLVMPRHESANLKRYLRSLPDAVRLGIVSRLPDA